MSTRAIQIDLLLAGLVNPTTGEVVDSGTVYFYSAGTTDAKNVWTEKEKTNAYTSYSLNGIGAVQLYGEGNYKIVVKDSGGSTVQTLDNVRLKYPNYYVHNISSNYTQTSDDDYLRVDTTSGDITITCLAAASWEHPLKVKRISGSNNIIIDPNGSELIDGSSSITITSDGVVEIMSTGSALESIGFISGVNEPLSGDSTSGRVFRMVEVVIDNGTNANTLAVTRIGGFNGDSESEQDNITGTVGNYTYNGSYKLTIEASGLEGNCVGAFAQLSINASGTAICVFGYAVNNDIVLEFSNATTGAGVDLDVLVDTGAIRVKVIYITDA